LLGLGGARWADIGVIISPPAGVLHVKASRDIKKKAD